MTRRYANRVDANQRTCEFVVDGEPQSWKRPGRDIVNKDGKQRRADLNETEQERIGWHARIAWKSAPTAKPVCVSVVYVVKSKLRYGDIDNLVKNLLDAMQGIVYENDNQVYKLNALRIRASEQVQPQIAVRVTA